jgi:hypothetical protein
LDRNRPITIGYQGVWGGRRVGRETGGAGGLLDPGLGGVGGVGVLTFDLGDGGIGGGIGAAGTEG